MISYLLNTIEQFEAWLKRHELARIKRLETDLAQAKIALAFYAQADLYPQFWVAGQRGEIVQDNGARARHAMKQLRMPSHLPMSLNEIRDALRAAPLPALPTPLNSADEDGFEIIEEFGPEQQNAWATWRTEDGTVHPERRVVEPA